MLECVHITKPLTTIEATKLLKILKKRWKVSKNTEAALEICSTGGYLILNSVIEATHIFGYYSIPDDYNINIINASRFLQKQIKYNKDLK